METLKNTTKLLLLLSFLCTAKVNAEILVIVNSANPLRSISAQDLKNIYLGKSHRFPDGGNVEAFNLDYDGTREKFEAKILGKNKSALGRYWSKRIFTGKGRPPKSVGDDRAMIETVSRQTDAIGYIKAGTASNKVKVIYRLR